MLSSNDFKLVRVKWLDSHVHQGWDHLDDIIRNAKNERIIESVGWIIQKTKKYIVLASHLDRKMASDCMTIPKGCIKSIKPI